MEPKTLLYLALWAVTSTAVTSDILIRTNHVDSNRQQHFIEMVEHYLRRLQESASQYKNSIDRPRPELETRLRMETEHVPQKKPSRLDFSSSRVKRDLRDYYVQYMRDEEVPLEERMAAAEDYFRALEGQRPNINDLVYPLSLDKRQPPDGFHAVRGKRSSDLPDY